MMFAAKMAFSCRHGYAHGDGCGHGGWQRRHHRHHGGWQHRRYGSEQDWEDDVRGYGGGWRGPVGRSMGLGGLWGIAEQLELTPSQRDTVKQALRELKDKVRGMRSELGRSREDVARVMRSEDFDVDILGDLFSRHDDVMREMREEVTGALGRIHAVLDDVQRERLGRILAKGWR